ncbi:sugar phosphate isomerase/epimerase family protein [Paenibacillus koleovorans]|uniref:sugar phosphate isomerase/epimerase family protein n=1 Tax=Paenibacillus koleovorans TaxID=121608 RepID=UPI000FDB9713|nr:TIM barrel protein [Paenibacillus koleovorans]
MNVPPNVDISICSFSFHRLLAAGKQDIFQYIHDCKSLGCTQLDPWNAHLSQLESGSEVLHAGKNPGESHHLTAADDVYLERVKAEADKVGLPFGCIAVDGAHIYEEQEDARRTNREKAYRWIGVAAKLGAKQIRIDAGGPAVLTDEVLAVIADGYRDLVARAEAVGVEVLMENHWGPSRNPDQVVRIMEAVPRLGLLFDSYNWEPGKQAEGWMKCAKYARLSHIKTFVFNDEGEELTQNIASFCRLLLKINYTGSWGVESVPRDGDEFAAARRTVELITRSIRSAAPSRVGGGIQ